MSAGSLVAFRADAPGMLRRLARRWADQGRRARLGLVHRTVTGPGRGPSPLGVIAAGLAVAAAVAASCRTVPRLRPVLEPAPPALVAPPALDALVPAPRIRVGILTEARRVSLGAEDGVVAWGGGGASGGWLVPHVLARATLVPVVPDAGPRYQVQVASLLSEEGAREFAGRVHDAVGLEPGITWSDATRTWRVRVGDFESRERATGLQGQLSRAGIGGSRIVEVPPRAGGGRLRLVETADEYESVLVVPAVSGQPVEVGAQPYRGVVEVRVNDSGTLTLVDVVGLEDYLRGVVPNELSPGGFPSLEALKAQAVAARTYALRHLGEFEARGYDICATAACQVYRGLSSEHPLSDQAVQETAGIVALYHGRPINAFYTSTCGGHTEDGENVFGGEGAPYLKGVACLPERKAWGTIRAAAPPAPLGGSPRLTRDAVLLAALGVVQPQRLTPGGLDGLASAEELRRWTTRLAHALRRQECPSPTEPPLERKGTFLRHLVATLCWSERASRLVAPADADYLLSVADRAELLTEEVPAATLLVEQGVLSPGPDGRLRAGQAIGRGEAVSLLAGVARIAGPPALVEASFRGVDQGVLRVLREDAGEQGADADAAPTEETYPLAPGLRLFRALDGEAFPAQTVSLAAGDQLRLVLDASGSVGFLEATQSRLGASADRMSRYFRWEVRETPGELARNLARYGSVGRVLDVSPLRIGASGRVIEMSITGTAGELVLRGLEVRRGLGLRENLFVVDRERSPDGGVARFVFTGKGWGHGVGLCQVGAYGMAVSGSTYQEILEHYYTGITVAPYRP